MLTQYFENKGLDNNGYWSRQEQRMKEMKKIAHQMHDHYYSGHRTFMQFKKTSNYKNLNEK